jgi:hypothetical protein
MPAEDGVTAVSKDVGDGSFQFLGLRHCRYRGQHLVEIGSKLHAVFSDKSGCPIAIEVLLEAFLGGQVTLPDVDAGKTIPRSASLR